MSSPRSLQDRLREARAALADVTPAEGPLVAPVLAEIEGALARLTPAGHAGNGAVSAPAIARPAAFRESILDEIERLTPTMSERSALFDAVLNHSPHGILIADAQGKLVVQNAAAIRIWAGSAETTDVASWGQYRAFHPDGRPYEANDWAMAKSLSEGVVNEAREIHFVRFDGTHGYMIGSCAPIFGAGKKLLGAVSLFADITRLKQVEETLRVTEQQLSTTLRSIGDGVIATDEVGLVTFMNDVAEQLTGWTTHEARGKHLDAVLPLLDEVSRAAVESPIARVKREDGVVSLSSHTRLIRRDGTERAIDDSAAPIRDAKGNLAGVVLIFRDITEKRLDEERRAFLSEISTELLETSLDYEARLVRVAELAVNRLCDWAAIDMIGEDGTPRRLATAHVNPGKITWLADLVRRYPVDPNAATGVPNILRTGSSELVAEITDEMLVAGARDSEHLQLIRDIGLRSYMGVPLTIDGRTFGAITFATAETNRHFGPEDLAFAQEIARRAATPIDNARLYSEAKEARALAEEAEQRFRSLAEAIPQIVWAVYPDGKHEYLSPKWYEYTGQPGGDPIAERLRQAIHPDDEAESARRWADAQEKGQPWQLEYRLRRADGVYRWHLGRSVPVLEDGRVVKWYGTATDINDQKRAIRTRDDILATVSHDLRNPLGNILLSAELLEELVKDEGGSLVGNIKSAANRMSVLIRDLLDITAVEGGELSVHRRPVSVGPLMAEAVEQQQALARQRSVTLRLIPATEERIALCDRNRILQVFANLIGNALKFTPESGTITVGHAAFADEVHFTVADTGPGIPPERRQRVFDRFWRDKESSQAGSGLGLAICKGIIEQHGGRIWVEDNEGGGARFVFTIPLPDNSVVNATS